MLRVKIIVATIFLMSLLYFISVYAGRMTGTVVEAETGKPIVGAVVLVEWTMTKGFGLTYTTSYEVKEKVTDNKGQFAVWQVMNPLVDKPVVTIYKKGYVAWSSRWIFPDWRNRDGFKWGDQTFEMKTFKDTYSYVNHGNFISRSINDTIGWDNKKLFIKTYYDSEGSLIIQERNKRDKEEHGGTH